MKCEGYSQCNCDVRKQVPMNVFRFDGKTLCSDCARNLRICPSDNKYFYRVLINGEEKDKEKQTWLKPYRVVR